MNGWYVLGTRINVCGLQELKESIIYVDCTPLIGVVTKYGIV